MTQNAVNLDESLASFDDLWSPRIVARINDYDVRATKVKGDFIWHFHENTDEFFLVLDGALDIGIRDQPDGGERVVHLEQGEIFVVPRGVEHCPSSPGGASIMVIEPAGTLTTGNRTEDIPDHIDSTTGHPVGS